MDMKILNNVYKVFCLIIITCTATTAQSHDVSKEALDKMGKCKEPLAERANEAKVVTDVMRLMMFREGGKLIGFKVFPACFQGGEALLAQHGLAANDIVVAVNNDPVSDGTVTQKFKLLDEVSAAKLGILRNSINLSIDVKVEKQI